MVTLITGANGQLGQDFQLLCKERKFEFIATDLELDITNLDLLRNFVKNKHIEVIINCAAYNAVDNAEKDWRTAYLINGIGPRNLAIVANEIGAKFVHYSTDYIFDGEKEEPYTILDTPNPISKYGESKLLGEKFTLQLSRFYYLIRVSWVFGKGNVNFVKKILEWSREKSVLSVVDDQISSPTYTFDLARITFDLLKTDAYGLYHITNSEYCSRYDWANYILKRVNWKGELRRAKSQDFNTLATRPKFSALENFGIKETIGYKMPKWNKATDRFLEELDVI